MDQVKQVLRYHHYVYKTEQTYCDWLIHGMKFYKYETHSRDMGKEEIGAFLSYLATDRKGQHLGPNILY